MLSVSRKRDFFFLWILSLTVKTVSPEELLHRNTVIVDDTWCKRLQMI